MRELDVNVRMRSDIAGAKEVNDALDGVAAKAKNVSAAGAQMGSTLKSGIKGAAPSISAASQLAGGLDAAMQGGARSALGLAQSIYAVGRALIVANPILAIVTLGLIAAQKALDHFKGKYEAASKAAEESSRKLADFSASLRELREQAHQVSFSIASQVEWLQKLGEYSAYAAQAVDRLAASQKRAVDAAKNLGLAQIDLREAQALRAAGSDPQKTATAKADAEAARIEARHRADRAAAEYEAQQLARKQQIARESMRDLERARAEPDDIASARQNLSDLERQRQGARQDPKRYIALSTQIQTARDNLKELEAAEKQRLDTLDQQLNEQNTALQQLGAELRANEQLLETIDAQYESAKLRLAAQRALNAAAEREAQLRAKSADDEQRATRAAQQRAQHLDIQQRAAQRRAGALSDIAAEQERRILEPGYASGQDRAERQRAREQARLSRRIERAQSKADRGVRGKWIDEALDLGVARTSAHEAKLAAANLESAAQRAQVDAARTLDDIKTLLNKNLSAAG